MFKLVFFCYSLVRLWETGLTRYWTNNLTPTNKGADQCFVKSKDVNSSVSQVGIKLQDLASAFLILGVGIGVSLLSFLMEILASKQFLIKENHKATP